MNPFDLDFVRLGARRSPVNSIINLENAKIGRRYRADGKWEIDLPVS